MALFDEYVAKSQPSPATLKFFMRKVRAFIQFLGHDNARRISKRDVVTWKDHLLACGKKDGSPLSAASVRNTFLPAIKSALRRGAENEQLSENVAEGVTVAGSRRRQVFRPKSFSNSEAKRS